MFAPVLMKPIVTTASSELQGLPVWSAAALQFRIAVASQCPSIFLMPARIVDASSLVVVKPPSITMHETCGVLVM